MGNLLGKLSEGLVSKTHKAFTTVTEKGFMKCQKPNGDVYPIVIQQFVKRVDAGELVIDNEDEQTGIILFRYVGSGAPKFS